ncbi:MAG: helix-turn-helix domain-containing protein [Hyphomicrobiales bacterium]
MGRAFEKIKAGLEEAAAIARGEADPSTYRVHVPVEIDVKALRRKFKLSQDEFATRFGFTAARIRDWEQGRSKPDGALRAYLMVIERQPKAVEAALRKVTAVRTGARYRKASAR